MLHKALRREHKLKHWGRLQYGLFLKGVGLSLEDALRFWEQEFTKIMTADVFNKQVGTAVGPARLLSCVLFLFLLRVLRDI